MPAQCRVRDISAVYVTAVLEYCVAEFLEMAMEAAKDHQKKRITPRHMMLAIRQDEELNKLIKATIAGGGVVPDNRWRGRSGLKGAPQNPRFRERYPGATGNQPALLNQPNAFSKNQMSRNAQQQRQRAQSGYSPVTGQTGQTPFQQPIMSGGQQSYVQGKKQAYNQLLESLAGKKTVWDSATGAKVVVHTDPATGAKFTFDPAGNKVPYVGGEEPKSVKPAKDDKDPKNKAKYGVINTDHLTEGSTAVAKGAKMALQKLNLPGFDPNDPRQVLDFAQNGTLPQGSVKQKILANLDEKVKGLKAQVEEQKAKEAAKKAETAAAEAAGGDGLEDLLKEKALNDPEFQALKAKMAGKKAMVE